MSWVKVICNAKHGDTVPVVAHGKLGRAPKTVRGWLRRFGGRVEAVRAVFTRWCRALGPGPGHARDPQGEIT